MCFEVIYSPAVTTSYRGTSPSSIQVEIVFIGNDGLPERKESMIQVGRTVNVYALQQLTRIKEGDAISMHSSFRRNDPVEGTSVPVVRPSGKKVSNVTDNAGPNRMGRYLPVVRGGHERAGVPIHHAIG